MNLANAPIILSGHEGSVYSTVFSLDGQILASGGVDNTIRLWNMTNLVAEPVVLHGHHFWVNSVAFNPDGQTLASGSIDTTIRLWIFLGKLVEIGCQQVRRNLTWMEWQHYLPGESYHLTCPNWPAHPSVREEESNQ